jgi:hypothetical protein
MRKNSYSIVLTIVLPFLLIMHACKPDTPDQQKYLGTYPLGDIKDYLYFKPGSMWVYECDSTGELDTQVMVSCDTPWVIKSFIKYQLLTCKIQSINEGSTYSSPLPFGDIYYKKEYSYFWSITRYRSNPKDLGSGRDCIFFKPYDTNSLGGLGDSPCKYKGLLTNYTVLGKTYDTVRVFQVQTGGTFPYCKIKSWNVGRLTYYWAKNVGLVRLFVETAYDGTKKAFNFNWNLKTYDLK